MDKKLAISTLDLVECLSTAMDLISPALANHQRRVGYIALQLAKEASLPIGTQKDILIAGLLHDCGALAMPGRLQTLRFDLYEDGTFDPASHAEAGYQLIRQFRLFTEVPTYIRFHHQPWNKGAKRQDGEEVPMAAHIIHLADRVDVLVRGTDHILLQRKGIEAKIDAHCGTLFCPALVDAFHRVAHRECFWLDIASISMGAVLAGESGFAHESLTSQDLLDMARLFGHIIDFRSRFTATHSSGVSAVASALARLSDFSEHQCMLMQIAGNLHDLGKLAVPLEILNKPGKLTEEEFTIVKAHTYYTHKILSNFRDLSDVRQWAAFHHEKMDGSGYPFHYHGRQLSMGARLMSVADVFTAITEDRPYRKGMPSDEATTVLRDMARQQALDHEAVCLLLDNFDNVNQTRIMAQTESHKAYQDFSNFLK